MIFPFLLSVLLLAAFPGQAGENEPRQLSIPENSDAEEILRLLGTDRNWHEITNQSRAFDDACMKRVAECRELRSFSNIYSSPFRLSSAGMALLGRCPKLRSLAICSEQPLEDDDLAAIARGCPELESLQICDGGEALLTDAGLAALGACRKLKHLNVRTFRPGAVGDHLFFTFANDHPELESLEFGEETPLQITNQGFSALARCLKLRRLSLPVARTDGDAAFEGWENLQALESLRLAGDLPLADAGLARLTRCSRLRELTLDLPGRIGDAAFAGRDILPSLEELRLSCAADVTDEGLARLVRPRLKNLFLYHAVRIGDAGMKSLALCENLEILQLGDARNVTDEGLRALAPLGRLKIVSLNASARITDAGVAALAKSAPQLEGLWLRAANGLTGKSLEALGPSAHLQVLVVGLLEVPPETLARFQAAKPALELIATLPTPPPADRVQTPTSAPRPAGLVEVF